VRIVVADDSLLLREGLQLLLTEAGHEVVAGVGDGPQLVAAALRERPDVVIADVRMPPSHTDEGLRAAVEIRAAWPDAAILVLSQYVVQSYADELLAAGEGSIGYLLKDRVSDIDDFLDSLQRVADGGTVLDPQVVAQLMAHRRVQNPLSALTPREREVLALMAQGHTTAGNAAELGVSEGAVEKHTGRIFAKLGLHADDGQHRRVRAVLAFLRD
jgi:DNA-binding NarL/FixJ family response regulator